MKSLFDKTYNQEIIDRIDLLSPDSKSIWGKMDVCKMLLHAQRPLMVAFGEMKLKRSIIGILFGRLAKRKLLNPEPFEKNLPTSPQFIVKENPEFEFERQNLRFLVKRFADLGPSSLKNEIHPFFGKLTVQEWDTLQLKHLDHHLRQFGV
jgi:hypothetical protein